MDFSAARKGSGMARIVELIFSDEERRGKGVEGDPIRCIAALYDKSGVIVAWYDPYTKDGQFIPENIAR